MKFDWKRFWCPADGSFSLADHGFLYDPDSEFGKRLHPDVVPFSELEASPCAVLLGEPGIGKSTAIKQDIATTRRRVQETGGIVIAINLGEYGDEGRLIDDILQSESFRHWLTTDSALHLFLDSLDECRLQIPHVAKILRREFSRIQTQLGRLHLRIACRTADWPSSLTESLEQLWGGPPLIFQLVPLRRRDVFLAAEREGLDADAFIADLIRSGAQPLAIKPLSLRFLLDMYKSGKGLPASQAELYERGCRLLCEEANPDRQDARQKGLLSADQRFAIASRIAGALVLCNKSSIFRIDSARNASSAETVAVSDIVGKTEVVGGSATQVGSAEIEEALGTGLFSGRGDGRVGFAHQTYAEFLAARYLMTSAISFNQKMALLRNSACDDKRIVPQLAETAAWLAGMDRDVFREILDCDPQILIRSDVAQASEADRQLLIDKLLKLFAAEDFTVSHRDDAPNYHKLNHSQLARQLTPIISDLSEGTSVRTFAINVAMVCGTKELQNLLADVALNLHDEFVVRLRAAYAVAEVSDAPTIHRLKPLATTPSEEDEDFALRAVALRALWPEHLSADELFASLAIPRDGSYGAYRIFLSHELVEHLRPDGLPAALRWAANLTDAEMQERSVEKLIAEIALQGWIHFDEPGVQGALGSFAIASLRQHHHALTPDDNRFEDSERKRHFLAEICLRTMDDFSSHGLGLIFRLPRLVRTTDMSWLLEKVLVETDPAVADRWIDLIDRLIDPAIPGQIDALIQAASQSGQLAEALKPRFAPVALASPEAEEMRQPHREYSAQRLEYERRTKPVLLDPPPNIRVEQHLAASEAGDSRAWYLASCDLQLEPTSRFYPQELEVDVTVLPGWLAAGPDRRARLVVAAQRFLTEHSAGEDWVGTNSTPDFAFAGYKALMLLYREAPAQLTALPEEVWARWAPIIVGFFGFEVVAEDQSAHDTIARLCAERAPEAVTRNLKAIFSEEVSGKEVFILPRFVERAWNESIGKTLLEAATASDVNPKTAAGLFEALLKHGSPDAAQAARHMLSLPLPSEGRARELAIPPAVALLRHAQDAGWDALWPAFESDAAFGRSVVESVAMHDMHNPSIALRIAERDLATFYIWLRVQYPHDRELMRGRIGTTQAIHEYRDSLLHALMNGGTRDAVVAVSAIAARFPELDWLKRAISEARNVTLRATWCPLSPTDLIELTHRPDSRLVQSAAQLQDVIIESLGKLQAELQGETPAAPDLWDEVDKGKFKPKDENHLSDYVKRHLERDLKQRGIIALREVEIRRGEAQGEGERTDIHVTGIVPSIAEGAFETVRVIIEVKGYWHSSVNTAMEAQLVFRYLRDNDCQHGIYLVGWYHCEQWDKRDSRYNKSRKESAQATAAHYDAQAVRLSNSPTKIRSFVLNAALR
jgi:hypothetical protein